MNGSVLHPGSILIWTICEDNLWGRLALKKKTAASSAVKYWTEDNPVDLSQTLEGWLILNNYKTNFCSSGICKMYSRGKILFLCE